MSFFKNLFNPASGFTGNTDQVVLEPDPKDEFLKDFEYDRNRLTYTHQCELLFLDSRFRKYDRVITDPDDYDIELDKLKKLFSSATSNPDYQFMIFMEIVVLRHEIIDRLRIMNLDKLDIDTLGKWHSVAKTIGEKMATEFENFITFDKKYCYGRICEHSTKFNIDEVLNRLTNKITEKLSKIEKDEQDRLDKIKADNEAKIIAKSIHDSKCKLMNQLALDL